MLEMKKKEKLKIILDTNILISVVIGKKVKEQFDDLLAFFYLGLIEIIICDELIDEFKEVVERPKIAKYINHNDYIKFLALFQKLSTHLYIKAHIKFASDEDDNYLLSIAQDSQADYLICGDKLLLGYKKFGTTKIISLTDFLNIMNYPI